MKFYVGIHMIAQAWRFDRCMISVNRLRLRRSDFPVNEWMLDSGAFTEVSQHGGYRDGPEEYAAQIARWAACGSLVAASSQDYMCEPFVLERTGLSIPEHQRLTIERYDALRALVPASIHVLPVLQGFAPADYVRHVRDYGERLTPGMWVGVGSVCKRQGDIGAIERVLLAIRRARPDLKLHGYGVKLTALSSSIVRDCLYSADSMAWSFAARKRGRRLYGHGRGANDWREAARFVEAIETQPIMQRQFGLPMMEVTA